jgi:hypothetical protein
MQCKFCCTQDIIILPMSDCNRQLGTVYKFYTILNKAFKKGIQLAQEVVYIHIILHFYTTVPVI